MKTTATGLRSFPAGLLRGMAAVLAAASMSVALAQGAPVGQGGEAAPAASPAQPPPDKKPSVFIDPQDGYVDLSSWLLEKKGFLPVPIIITEPAVGYGGGMVAMFFRQSMAEAAAQAKSTGGIKPPDIYSVAAAATQNGTQVWGGGALLSFLDDRWRYRGAIGHVDVNLDFFGVGNTLGEDLKIAYNLTGWLSSQQALYRLGESNNFVGLRWIYLNLDSTFSGGSARPELPPPSFASKSSGLGLSFEHDSRNNFFTPSRGTLASVSAVFYTPGLGSDNSFQVYRAHAFTYATLGKSLVLGGRLDGRAARGDVPFYQLPYIEMRGIPAVRYQDDNTTVAETEARWNMNDRWGLVGFIGAGRAWGSTKSFGDTGTKVSKGAGIRYQVARVLGMWVGVDHAWGPEDERAFYIQIGSAWR